MGNFAGSLLKQRLLTASDRPLLYRAQTVGCGVGGDAGDSVKLDLFFRLRDKCHRAVKTQLWRSGACFI